MKTTTTCRTTWFEDPVAKVRFPKFAAAAKLEQNGKTFYFIDESTLREFEKRSNERQTEGQQNNGNSQ